MSCGVGCRRGSDPALLWLWRRLVATAPIRPLAWEPPYAARAAQENGKKTKKKKKKKAFGQGAVYVEGRTEGEQALSDKLRNDSFSSCFIVVFVVVLTE